MNSLPPLVEPGPALGRAQLERFSRHVALPGLGLTGQRRLANARVLVVGAGGLGSPVLHYLTAAGIGTLGVVDNDTVDLSNLQRQVIHTTARVGMPKAESAAQAILSLNPETRVEVHPYRLTEENAIDLFARYDVIVDGTDNFATRYLANDAAALLRKPYVWGSVLRFDAQVTVFWEGAPGGRSLDYRDLLPTPPDDESVLSCSDAGVLGALCGMVGSLMATETIKLIAGIGDVLLGRVQNYDALSGSWREFEVRRSPERAAITREEWDERYTYRDGNVSGEGRAETLDLPDVPDVRSVTTVTMAATNASASVPTIEPRELAELLKRAQHEPGLVELVDVREPFERDIVSLSESWLIDPDAPAADLRARRTFPDAEVIVLCKSGVRSARAVRALLADGIPARSLRGGILAWVDEVDPSLPRY